jgi:3alpha(or 20beta)-hydroxysteroid dehydrogenase
LGQGARFVHLDVTQPDQWQVAVDVALHECGTLNVVVNNAGILNGNTLQNFPLADWQRIIDVNLTGTFLGMQAAVEPMIAAGGGSILNISSVEGLRAALGSTATWHRNSGCAAWPRLRHWSWRRTASGSTRSTPG